MSLTFRLSSTTGAPFAPRLGLLSVTRGDGAAIEVDTPGVVSCTTRGVIDHLSRDNVRRTSCVKWVHVPFESFLQIDPPVPTLQEGKYPLHTFLGFPPQKMILSMSLRDPADGREMPPNGKLFVSAQCARGTRKVTCPTYLSYVSATHPDIVFPLSDTPFTTPPHSQKRITKSIERSTQWLASIIHAPSLTPAPRPSIFLPMVGGTRPAARAAFAAALQEPLEHNPSKTLDDGVAGYVFDLLPLRDAAAAAAADTPTPTTTALIRASLEHLPPTKPRLATTPHSPHQILTLVRDVGIDLFDTAWAQRAADYGVALDFTFPPPPPPLAGRQEEVGHNLYDARYAHDYTGLMHSCTCAACAPTWTTGDAAEAYTRAYIHHLLHTHEMSAHALLVMHNLTVVDAFMRGIRSVLQEGDGDAFVQDVARFEEVYDAAMKVVDEARECWRDVDRARGKGRLARERAGRKAALDEEED